MRATVRDRAAESSARIQADRSPVIADAHGKVGQKRVSDDAIAGGSGHACTRQLMNDGIHLRHRRGTQVDLADPCQACPWKAWQRGALKLQRFGGLRGEQEFSGSGIEQERQRGAPVYAAADMDQVIHQPEGDRDRAGCG